jgi:hypothetical protein
VQLQLGADLFLPRPKLVSDAPPLPLQVLLAVGQRLGLLRNLDLQAAGLGKLFAGFVGFGLAAGRIGGQAFELRLALGQSLLCFSQCALPLLEVVEAAGDVVQKLLLAAVGLGLCGFPSLQAAIELLLTLVEVRGSRFDLGERAGNRFEPPGDPRLQVAQLLTMAVDALAMTAALFLDAPRQGFTPLFGWGRLAKGIFHGMDQRRGKGERCRTRVRPSILSIAIGHA